MITHLKDSQIFIFGSNMAGNHAGGAARQARDSFGAEQGISEGRTGKCYAFPTLTESYERVSNTQLKASRLKLYQYAEAHPELEFLLTKVGCGIAGMNGDKMAALFVNTPSNIILPPEWIVWNRVIKNRTKEPNGCWKSTLVKDKNGYTQLKYCGKQVKLHRFSYWIRHNAEIEGMLACHSCDNPSCFNPDHLWLGMPADNAKDRDIKKRHTTAPPEMTRHIGTDNGSAKLDDQEVINIRKEYRQSLTGNMYGGGNLNELATKYKVSRVSIRNIVRRKTWRHVE